MKQINFTERKMIEKMLKQGMRVRAIGRVLNRGHSTISEEINGLIRQYLPRYINMNKITQDHIYEIQEKLNNRPRKSLNYKTPNQIYSQLIESGRF